MEIIHQLKYRKTKKKHRTTKLSRQLKSSSHSKEEKQHQRRLGRKYKHGATDFEL